MIMFDNTLNPMQQQVLSITELNQCARELLEQNFGTIWVTGEISNLARPASGHCYFSLKDERAQVRCALFRSRAKRLNFDLSEGVQVLARTSVSLYEGRGDFQLIIESMSIAGDGALKRAFEALKKRLATEGLFDEEHKQAIPTLPQCIGVITSASGAAIHDILSVLKRRCTSIPVIIYPSLVQGKEAAAQIVAAIEIANQRAECDVLILARGGGSLEDLWPFNEESVARAIYTSHIPIVSGIGHQVDFSIADFVADHRAPTPSAAAESCSPNQHLYLRRLAQQQQRLILCIKHLLNDWAHQLKHLHLQLRHPKQRIEHNMQRLDYLDLRLKQIPAQMLQRKTERLNHIVQTLTALSPLATLQRGYAIAYKDKAILHHANAVTRGDSVRIQLAAGEFSAEVKSVKQPSSDTND